MQRKKSRKHLELKKMSFEKRKGRNIVQRKEVKASGLSVENQLKF
jgi:hypothetical protein